MRDEIVLSPPTRVPFTIWRPTKRISYNRTCRQCPCLQAMFRSTVLAPGPMGPRARHSRQPDRWATYVLPDIAIHTCCISVVVYRFMNHDELARMTARHERTCKRAHRSMRIRPWRIGCVGSVPCAYLCTCGTSSGASTSWSNNHSLTHSRRCSRVRAPRACTINRPTTRMAAGWGVWGGAGV